MVNPYELVASAMREPDEARRRMLELELREAFGIDRLPPEGALVGDGHLYWAESLPGVWGWNTPPFGFRYVGDDGRVRAGGINPPR